MTAAILWTSEVHEDYKRRRARQCAEIDQLDREITALGDKLNVAAEGTPNRKAGGGVVPVPCTSAAAPDGRLVACR